MKLREAPAVLLPLPRTDAFIGKHLSTPPVCVERRTDRGISTPAPSALPGPGSPPGRRHGPAQRSRADGGTGPGTQPEETGPIRADNECAEKGQVLGTGFHRTADRDDALDQDAPGRVQAGPSRLLGPGIHRRRLQVPLGETAFDGTDSPLKGGQPLGDRLGPSGSRNQGRRPRVAGVRPAGRSGRGDGRRGRRLPGHRADRPASK